MINYYKYKVKKGGCATPKCRGKHLKNRTICGKCKRDRYIKNHPIRYAYTALRNNAKRRGKDFDITFEQFVKFAKQAEYKDRGILRESLHIDRIDEAKGYSIDNIQLLPNHVNVKKYRAFDGLRNVAITELEDPTTNIDTDLPF